MGPRSVISSHGPWCRAETRAGIRLSAAYGSNASAKNASQPRSCRFKTNSFGCVNTKAPDSGADGEPQECRVLASATGGSGNGELSHRRTSFSSRDSPRVREAAAGSKPVSLEERGRRHAEADLRSSRGSVPGGVVEGTPRRPFLISKVWIQAVILVVLCGFFVLGLLAYRTYMAHPPVPSRVVDESGAVLFTGDDISKGQQVFLHNGLMEFGSVFGHGAYLGPDFTADYLRRSADLVRDSYGGAASSAAASRTVEDMRANRYDSSTKHADLQRSRGRAPSASSSRTTASTSPTPRPSTGCGRARSRTRPSSAR